MKKPVPLYTLVPCTIVSMVSVLMMESFFAAWARADVRPEPTPFATPEQLATKDVNVTQCLMAHNVPVMGFGMKVVCLEPSGKVAWVR